MKQITFQLKKGQHLKGEIEKIALENNIKAGVLLAAVGGLENAVLRMAGSTVEKHVTKRWDEPLDIISATGTISKEGCHIHVALADKKGNMIGGHLKGGCVVRSTVEIVIGIFEDVSYKRILNEETGFLELEVE